MTAKPPVPVTLRELTPARVGLGRIGASVPTKAQLRFALDHARARDAVHDPLDVAALQSAIAGTCGPALVVASQAADRTTYLARPDLGARLAPENRRALDTAGTVPCDLVVVLADGLSSRALRHAPELLTRLWPALLADGLRLAPPVIATQARVALGDGVGEALGAAMALVLIGERPGLSAADSLGAYLTWNPRIGRVDAERNCVSNIRPDGLAPEHATDTLRWLIGEAFRRRLTGVALKDESGLLQPPRLG